jgi:hypothetical protein
LIQILDHQHCFPDWRIAVSSSDQNRETTYGKQAKDLV